MSDAHSTDAGTEKRFEAEYTWVRGAFRGTLGQAVLTADRLLFCKVSTSAGGASGMVFNSQVTEHAILDIPISSVTGATRHKKGMQKDRIKLATSDGEYLFSGGWNDLGPALRAQIELFGRTTVDIADDAWRAD